MEDGPHGGLSSAVSLAARRPAHPGETRTRVQAAADGGYRVNPMIPRLTRAGQSA
jgi:hypothetical protein